MPRNDEVICPVCREDYDDPRILHCGHSVCKNCILDLLGATSQERRSQASGSSQRRWSAQDEASLECPECGTMYVTVEGIESFPRNRYHLAVRRRRTPTPQNKSSKKRFKKCRLHDRDISLFCQKKDCNKPICQLCHTEEHIEGHRKGDVVDIEHEEKEKTKALLEMLDSTEEKLQMRKEKFLAAKDDVDAENRKCLQTLDKIKMEMVRAFVGRMNRLKKKAEGQISTVNCQFDGELSTIEERLSKLDDLREGTETGPLTYSDLMDRLNIVQDIEKEITRVWSGPKSHRYTEFETDITVKEMKALCGSLSEKENNFFLPDGKSGIQH